MRVLIAGAGEVGFRVGRDLVYRGHEVTLVDSNSSSVKRAQTLDAQVFKGNAASAKFLMEEASIKDAVQNADLVILHTEWNDFKSINFKNLVKGKKFIIFDMRNLYSSSKIKQQGFMYFSVGK